MDVALARARAGDADEPRPLPELRQVGPADVAHGRPQAADHLVQYRGDRPLVGHLAFDPLLHQLLALQGRPAPKTTRALVLAPTRELAVQIEAAFRTFAGGARLTTLLVLGGTSRSAQVRALARGVDVVVATPGRLTDLMADRCRQLGWTDQQLAEILAVAATNYMYNTFFKFRDLSGSALFEGMGVGLRAHTFASTWLSE